MKLQRPGTGLLVLRIAVVAVTCLLLLGAGPTWKEKQTWKQAQRAQTAGQHEKVLQLTTLLIEDFPEGDYRQDSHRLAGSAAMALQQWPVARANLETYLQLGGRDDLPKLQFWIALCLAREGKLEVAPAALRNVAVNDPDLVRSAAAARELVELHLFEGNGMAALQGQGLLLQRGNFTTAEDLPVSRRAAETLSDEQLEEIEQDLEHAEVAGLAGYLLLERQEALLDAPESDPQRMAFALHHPEHFLLPEVPGALEWTEKGALDIGKRIGVLLPLTGRYAGVGQAAQRGIELSLARARLLGWTDTELITIDTTGDPAVAAEGLRKLAEDDQVSVVLGPILDDEGELLASQAEALGVPMVMMVRRPGLTIGRINVFNTWLTAEEQTEALLDHAMERLQLTSFVIAYPEKESSALLASQFWDAAEARGAKVAAVESYKTDSKDFRETARRILGTQYLKYGPLEGDYDLPLLPERKKPHMVDPITMLIPGRDFHAVFVPDNYKRVALLAPAFVYERINLGAHLPRHKYPPVTLLGGAALNHADLGKRGDRSTRGAILVDGFFLNSTQPAVQDFRAAYREAYYKDPGFIEANAYDTSLLALQVMADTEMISRREFRRRLTISTPLESITGARGMRSNGEMRHEMLCLTVRRGSIIQLWPPPVEEPEGASKAEAKDKKAEAKDKKAEAKDKKAEAKDKKTEAKDKKTEAKDKKAEATDKKAEATDKKAEATDKKAEATDKKAEGADKKAEGADKKAEGETHAVPGGGGSKPAKEDKSSP